MKKTTRPPLKRDRQPSPQALAEAKAAAFLRTLGLKGQGIGHELYPESKNSESKVSRRLQLARDMDYLIEVLNPDRISPDEVVALSNQYDGSRQWKDLERELLKGSKESLKSVQVSSSGQSDLTNEMERDEERIRNVARNSASGLFRLLLQCKTGLGVCWGPTLSVVGAALANYRAIQSVSGGLGELKAPVFPTTGLPPELEGSTSAWSSTQVARGISLALKRTAEVLSLESIPAVLTGEDADIKERRDIIFNFLKCRQSYRKIYGSGKMAGLVDVADGLLTSAGTNDRWPKFGSDVMQPEGIEIKIIQELTIGDIGGVLIPRAEIATDKNRLARFEKLRQQWTGLTFSHITKVNANAEKTGGPGVVLIATGKAKADIVRELVMTHRVVRHLVIDQSLAKELWSKLSKPGAT